jgi:hypothetical protein
VLTVNAPTNLLLNGDFNTPASSADPDHWTLWRFGPEPVWTSHERPARLQPSDPNYWADGVGVYDGTYQMGFGGNGDNRSAGAYQLAPVQAGRSYTLTVDAGADKWWLPVGEIHIIWLDATGTTELGRATTYTTDSIHDPDLYDVGVPYQAWRLDATAPPGTHQAKIEFANPVGTGSAWFDNADFQDAAGVPVADGSISTPFAVTDAPVNPISLRLMKEPGMETVQIDSSGGSVGAQYSLLSTTNLMPPVTWMPVPASTHAVTEEDESWSYLVTNTTVREQYFRSTSDSP